GPISAGWIGCSRYARRPRCLTPAPTRICGSPRVEGSLEPFSLRCSGRKWLSGFHSRGCDRGRGWKLDGKRGQTPALRGLTPILDPSFHTNGLAGTTL